MKKILLLFLITVLIVTGCDTKNKTTVNKNDELTQDVESSDNEQKKPESGESSGVIVEDITPALEQDDKKDKEELAAIVNKLISHNPLAITLGEYNENAGLYANSHTWLLYKDGFIPETNPNGSLYAPEWTVSAAGIIEFVEDELCYFIGPGCPLINNSACQGQYNFEKIENGWLFEVEILLYKGVMLEEALSYFWCIIDIDDENSSKWIYLNQEAFSKEDALLIATYLIDR